MILQEIRNYELLKAQIGQEGVEAFVGLIEMSVDRKFEEKQVGSASKQDVSDLKQDISNIRLELKEEISKVRVEFKDDLNKVKDVLLQKIYRVNVGQLLAIIVSVVTLVLLLLRK